MLKGSTLINTVSISPIGKETIIDPRKQLEKARQLIKLRFQRQTMQTENGEVFLLPPKYVLDISPDLLVMHL